MASVRFSDDAPTSSPPPSGRSGSNSPLSGGHDNSACVTVDPQDLELDVAEKGRGEDKLPRLTLMEEVLLLGIQDKEGYISVWNITIGYALRACILMELALRRRIGILGNLAGPTPPLKQRVLTVLSTLPTGDVLLDETLMMIKKTEEAGERMNAETWLDYLSGETWSFFKTHQLKQVSERITESLVQKGVLGSGTRSFFIFDTITHPVIDTNSKMRIISRLIALLGGSTVGTPATALVEEGTQCALLRTVCLACAVYRGDVMDSVFVPLQARTTANRLCDEILREFGMWPFGHTGDGQDCVRWLVVRAREESTDGEEDRAFELVAAVLEVLSNRYS
ncbi:GPP34-domain-containing protein [Mycena galericulata]|nr:GPP34-domain-containing protein [Mycena galericulata]